MSRDIDDSSDNVLKDWSAERPPEDVTAVADVSEEGAAWGTAPFDSEAEGAGSDAQSEGDGAAAEVEPGALSVSAVVATPPATENEEAPTPSEPEGDAPPIEVPLSSEHAAGELEIPDGYAVLEGEASGARRAVGVVASRFNGEVTSKLLDRALEQLDELGVERDAITVMVVPGAFELPLAATALAKTRRFACVVALGCVIRGDTPHFDYVASEAASGLQLAALETGVPVSFGLLTLDRIEQADARIEKGAEAVRTALEMADVFAHLRAAASR